MAGPPRIYDVDVDELPPYDELVDRLERVVKAQSARIIAGWAELQRQGIDQAIPHRTEVRYRKSLVAAMGIPVPPRPGRRYEAQARPLKEVGAAELIPLAAVGASAAVALAATTGNAAAILALAPIIPVM